ncbi:MAG: response regulator [Bacteroidota bacterium]
MRVVISSYSTVCIIEDNMVSQFATRYCLEQYAEGELSILVYDSAEDALEAFTEQMHQEKPLPDLIFLDLGLDKMDGWEFMKALEILVEKSGHPDIYILSSFSNSKDREVARTHPMVHGYIDKPLTKIQLESIFQSKSLRKM